MKASFPVNHNFYEECALSEDQLKDVFSGAKPRQIKALFDEVTEVTDDNERFKQVKIVGFRNIESNSPEEKLILRLWKKKDTTGDIRYMVQTGNYAGILYHNGCQFNITSGYGDAFLYRMLSFANDVYIDLEEQPAAEQKIPNEFNQIVAYLFGQSLEKAAFLGFPQQYITIKERSTRVKGKIDLNTYLQKEIPFSGYLTSSFRGRVFVQPIIDVLYAAVRKLNSKLPGFTSGNIRPIQQSLMQNYSGHPPTRQTIWMAISHPSLTNPTYAYFKRALIYAGIILNESHLDFDAQNQTQTSGFLFDISQLFEVYLEKLLRRNLPDWVVNAQYEVRMYDDLFFARKMIPDIVLEHNETGQIAVFDAKYKKMRGIKKDLDREDFYQIHTYIQYFHDRVMGGGLLYPISSTGTSNWYAEHLFGLAEHRKIKFIVDGVAVGPRMELAHIKLSEEQLINRMRTHLLVY